MTEPTTDSELSESENIAGQSMWTKIEADEMENQRLHLAKRANTIATIAAITAAIAAVVAIVAVMVAVDTKQTLETFVKNHQQQIDSTQPGKKTDGK